VVAEDTREVINITKLNAELKVTMAKIDQLRTDIDAIIEEIEGDKQ
jgi:type I restriction enzyme M protein